MSEQYWCNLEQQDIPPAAPQQVYLNWGEADGHLHTVLHAVTEGEGGDLTSLGARINIVKQGQEAGCGESYMGTDNLTLVTGMDLAGQE